MQSEYIWTFNGGAKITLRVPQTLASHSITSFIDDLGCVLCRTLSRDNITNKISKKLKLQHKGRIDEGRRYLFCKNCKKKGCEICAELLYDFFQNKSFLKQDNP